MQSLPKYSVLMSLYAKEKSEYFKLAIESMLNQTVAPDEIVIVEDGPLTDELYSELSNYKEKYPQIIHTVRNEKNMGLGLALNTGLKECRNNLIARMDTDDISKPQRCETQLHLFFQNPMLDICGCFTAQFIDSCKNVVSIRDYPCDDKNLKIFLKKRCPFSHMTVMFKKESVLKVGNYQHWLYNEDYFLWIRMALAKMKFANIPEILVYSRVGKERFKRRGGWHYFISNFKIEWFMYKKKMISFRLCTCNIFLRFVIQVLMPGFLRGFILNAKEKREY